MSGHRSKRKEIDAAFKEYAAAMDDPEAAKARELPLGESAAGCSDFQAAENALRHLQKVVRRKPSSFEKVVGRKPSSTPASTERMDAPCLRISNLVICCALQKSQHETCWYAP